MSESEWLTSDDPAKMLQVISGGIGTLNLCKASDRKLRLFACTCRFAQGKTASDVIDTYEKEGFVDNNGERYSDLEWARMWVAKSANNHPSQSYKADILREIVGNPFHRLLVTDTWVMNPQVFGFSGVFNKHWLTPMVLDLARAAYEERPGRLGEVYHLGGVPCRDRIEDGTLDPLRLAVLTDALEEAGCTDDDILRHLRGWRRCTACAREGGRNAKQCECATNGGWLPMSKPPAVGPHVRGCWALDLILGES